MTSQAMATFGANIPAPLSFEGDVAANWKKFHKNFKIYLGATGREKSAADVAAMNEGAKKDYYDSLGKLLLNIAGDEATTVSSSFGLNDDEEFNYIELVKKFEEYSAEDDNETYIRFMFNRTRQRDGETFDHFVAEARKRIKACGYGNLEDSLLKDRIVEGVRSQKLQQTLLAIKNLDLKTAISEGRSAESSTRYVSEIQQELASTVSVNAVRNHKQYKSQDKGQYKNQDKGFKKPDKQEFDCTRCGYSHTYGKCPAYGKTCVKCKGRNHFAKMCKTQAVHNVQVEENDQNNLNNFDYQVLFADSIGMEVITLNSLASQKAKPPQEYRQEIKVGNKIINFKLDPGSPASIIPPEELEALNIEESAIIPANIYIKPFGPDSPVIKAVGRVKILTKVGGKTKLVNYIIAPGEVPLFGIADCEEFGLIVRKVMSIDSTEHAIQTSAKEEFAQKNRDVFEGLGKFPGKMMFMSDLFSRTARETIEDESTMIEMVHSLSMSLPINDSLRSALVEATASDIGLQTVMKYLREGWPKHAEQLSAQAFPYFQVRNDIFCEDNLLYFNDQGQPRIIVPASLRAEVLKLVHGPAHLATDRCLSRAVQAFYWPGLSNHIQEFIKRCQICKKFLPMPAKHPLHPHPLPNLMWEAVSMDIASVGPKDYLVMYDSYSKWLEILKLPSKSASAVVDACKNVFAIHGFPQKIVCDNNPFNSFEFKSFAKECNSTIIFTSPHLHHSNGRAEKGVSIAKLILRKSIEERSDYRDSLREYRNTEIPSMGYSPAQLMFSRKMRTTLPVTNQDLKPVVPQSVKSKMLNQQRRTEKWYNKSARRTECNFQPGDPVIINLGNKGETWKEGNVIEKCKEPRSFLVQMKNGGQVRRATNHMRPDYQQSEIPWDPVYDMIRRRNVQKSLERSEQINQEREKTETNQEKDKTETNQEKDKTETNQEKDKTETNQEKDKTEKTKEKEKSEKIYQLIVPDWMFKENYVTRAGRTVKQTSSFTPS
ncbi:hypothetical protein FOCC_FOCC003030 [Frankliniella occidentalis]|nr:hypothetical protein FOCC_FOCC003030 [Frankliniella occidentalis]